jgi:hypothetical protein
VCIDDYALTLGSSAGVSTKASYSINLSLGAAKEHPFQSGVRDSFETAPDVSPGELPPENCDPLYNTSKPKITTVSSNQDNT